MTWKKTWFSYVLWGCYLLMVGGFAVISLENRGEQFGITGVFALLLALAPFLAGALICVIVRLICGRRQKRLIPEKVWPVAEGLIFTGLLAAGLLFRISSFPARMEENVYFDLAKVTLEGPMPELGHGAVYIYVLLLRCVLLLFGNCWQAGVILQLLLQFGAAVLLYCGVRRLTGGFPALWSFGFFMLAPFLVRNAYQYGPELLYLFLYSLGFCLLTACVKRYWRGGMTSRISRPAVLLLGICLGALIHLDVMGVSLLLLCAGFFHVRFREKVSEKHKHMGGVLSVWILAGALIGLLGMFVPEIVKGAGVFEVLDTWERLFMPESWPLQNVVEIMQAAREMDLITNLLLVLGLTVGVFGFMVKTNRGSQSVFHLLLLGSLLLTYSSRAGETMNRQFLFYLWLILVSGCGIYEIFSAGEGRKETEAPANEPAPAETPADEPQKSAVKWIENPLPLPKKHVKKTMGYGRNIPLEKLHYDVEIDPEDDFPLQ